MDFKMSLKMHLLLLLWNVLIKLKNYPTLNIIENNNHHCSLITYVFMLIYMKIKIIQN